MTTAPYILLDDQLAGALRLYEAPLDIITVYDAQALNAALTKLQEYHQQGYYLAGYAAYELGYILEPRLRKKLPDNFKAPLLQFGVFRNYSGGAPDVFSNPPYSPQLSLKPVWTQTDYLAPYERVKDYIKSGDIYQINLCFPMHGKYDGTAWDLYASLRARQPVHYGGVVSLKEGPEIISLSPELFFKKTDNHMTMQPMKGTIKRLNDPVSDAALRDSLKADIKSQAENLMIVDLLRNDLSRVSAVGSVKVPELYSLETYPTLHQMTSKVTSTLTPETTFIDIFKALFPCGSVTGAPKIRAMEIIRQLEPQPRGAYCGAMGYIDPPQKNGQSDSCFNVAIRTLILEGSDVRYNVGSGVVLDSGGPEEYRECLLKAQVITQSPAPAKPDAPLHLIETMRFQASGEIMRLNLHLARLSRSAQALRFPLYRQKVYAALRQLTAAEHDQRLRMTLEKTGRVTCTLAPLNNISTPLKVAISKNSLSPDVQETRYKVSERNFYESERKRLSDLCGADEVLFLNSEGELCEGAFTSLFIQNGEDSFLTPDIRCGLLPGVLRAQMLGDGRAAPAILSLANLHSADIFMGNSLRGLMPATLLSLTPR